jgi:hypothetical protein
MSTADLDSQLDAILAAASASGGTGGRTVTVLVTDGTNTLQNAVVRLTEGTNTFRAVSNSSGIAVLNVDDATYKVAVTKTGYSFGGATLVVNADKSQTYAMSAMNITPGADDLTTGYLVTRVKGVATPGITIRYQQAQEPSGDRGSSYDDAIYSAVSNSEGIAELSLVKGGLYYVWRSASTRPMNLASYRVLKADGSAPDATLALPSHVGA